MKRPRRGPWRAFFGGGPFCGAHLGDFADRGAAMRWLDRQERLFGLLLRHAETGATWRRVGGSWHEANPGSAARRAERARRRAAGLRR